MLPLIIKNLYAAIARSEKMCMPTLTFCGDVVFKLRHCSAEVKVIDIDTVSVEGRGIRRMSLVFGCRFWIKSLHLTASQITIQYTAGAADTVSVKDVATNVVEVTYTVHCNVRFQIAVFVCGVLHSTHSPILHFSCAHLKDYQHNAAVVQRILSRMVCHHWRLHDYTALASIVVDAASLHLANADIQEVGMQVVRKIAIYGSPSNYPILLPYVYSAMDAHKRQSLQNLGCWILEQMLIKADPNLRRILMTGRALEICRRAWLVYKSSVAGAVLARLEGRIAIGA